MVENGVCIRNSGLTTGAIVGIVVGVVVPVIVVAAFMKYKSNKKSKSYTRSKYCCKSFIPHSNVIHHYRFVEKLAPRNMKIWSFCLLLPPLLILEVDRMEQTTNFRNIRNRC